MDDSMDRKQYILILIFSLITPAFATPVAPAIWVGIGNTLDTNILPIQITKDFGALHIEQLSNLYDLNPGVQNQNQYWSIEVEQAFNQHVAASIKGNFSNNDKSIHRPIVTQEDSNAIELITKYKINEVSYELSVGLKKQQYTLDLSGPYIKPFSIAGYTPSLGLSTAINLSHDIKILIGMNASYPMYIYRSIDNNLGIHQIPDDLINYSTSVELSYNLNALN